MTGHMRSPTPLDAPTFTMIFAPALKATVPDHLVSCHLY
jgi:hypothetical protein